MALTDVDIAAQALVMLGEEPIQAFTEDSEAAQIASQLYATVIEDLLSRHDWSFARNRVQLGKSADAPVNEWKYKFVLPSDRAGPPLAVMTSTSTGRSNTVNYELEDNYLFCNEETIVVEYVARPPVSAWPPYFRRLAILALAAELAMPITDQRNTAESFYQRAFGPASDNGRGGAFGIAARTDDRSKPSTSLLDNVDPLTAARFA